VKAAARHIPKNLARKGCFDYFLMGEEPLPAAKPRLGRRTALTFPLVRPPHRN
jgi:hypothetical protein